MATVSTTNSTICPNCGTSCSLGAAESRIAELQSQVEVLTLRATSAVDKLADYEDELRKLRLERGPPTPPATVEAPAPTTYTSRFGASLFGTSRRPSPANTTASEPPPRTGSFDAKRESDLQAALAQEQDARRKAEGKVNQMNQEVEDLSVQLFQQANEMVANERRERAKLEERVEILEKRDADKKKRLERLENAMTRIDRLRGLLAPPDG